MNLWPKILSFLSFSETSLRKHAVWVCGTAIQNNIRAQKAVSLLLKQPFFLYKYTQLIQLIFFLVCRERWNKTYLGSVKESK